jgi:hypothetical protein
VHHVVRTETGLLPGVQQARSTDIGLGEIPVSADRTELVEPLGEGEVEFRLLGDLVERVPDGRTARGGHLSEDSRGGESISLGPPSLGRGRFGMIHSFAVA